MKGDRNSCSVVGLRLRFFEIDLLLRSEAVAAQFEERFSAPAEVTSTFGRRLTGAKERAKAATFAAISPFL